MERSLHRSMFSHSMGGKGSSFYLTINEISLPQVESVLPVTVTGDHDKFSCPYLDLQAFLLTSSPCTDEEGECQSGWVGA